VIGVSWVDIVMFCRWLSEVTGLNIDIPTEAQWLAAAGYGINKQLYPWGNTWIANACNSKEYDRGKRRVTPVDRFENNVSPYGCIDMLGNIWEWTKSLYNFSDNSGFEWRAVRGGANYTNLKGIGNLARLVAHPGHFLFVHDLGFRIVTSNID
jgi:formylglycine-generating enzyme required for sulfatase activity